MTTARVESFRDPGVAARDGSSPDGRSGELSPDAASGPSGRRIRLSRWSPPQTRRAPIMTEPQSWVLIGTFAAAILGGMTFTTRLITTTLTQVITANTDRLDVKIDARCNELGMKIDTVEAVLNHKIDGVESRLNAKIDSVEAGLKAKIDGVEGRLRGDMARIDADVTAITKRIWNDPPRD
ncbi:hypothetical protein LPW41_05910 [Microbacterium sp. JC 701]|uniref:hypothetical protein n=1 Tax=unclassified Microbacterium TaxID=2609290 RepID=UPI0016429320|nr:MULTISPECIES: hypothetical protein [unclassified Microbacterium]MCD2169234.1 hypothetical protein [Microbacterium sp. JC 701]